MILSRQAWLPLLVILVSTLSVSAQSRHPTEEAFNRGRDRYLRGDFSGAMADFTSVIEMSFSRKPSEDRKNWTTGKALSDIAADRIMFIDPLTAAAYANRGLALARVGDYEGGVADCDRAIKVNPGLSYVYINRALIRWLQNDFNGALADLDKALRISPRDAQAYDTRGNVRREWGDPRGAIPDFDRAIQLEPNRAAFHCSRGQARLQLNDADGAMADFPTGTSNRPTFGLGLLLSFHRVVC